MNGISKPILSIADQVIHLESKGVQFSIMDKPAALHYLEYENNYFRLASYRKNYSKNPGGIHVGKYIDLEFAYLVDLAAIDMQLRYCIMQMALDIEHHIKLDLLRSLYDRGEDGYSIVCDYRSSLTDAQRDIYDNEISRMNRNIYCGDLLRKYSSSLPVWVMFEVIPLGRLVSFYEFCANRFADKNMIYTYYQLLVCKEIRNASAHSSCILNDLRSGSIRYRTSSKVTQAIASIPGMNRNLRRNRMSNNRIQQIVTLLYTYNQIIRDNDMKRTASDRLSDLKDRMSQHIDYYYRNCVICNTFEFLREIIDAWY